MGNAVGTDAPVGAMIGTPSISGAPAGGAPAGGAPGGGVSIGGAGAIGPGGLAAPGQAVRAPDAYSLQGIYFKREWYPNVTDCLNAASGKGLPLDLCR
jgi:hypothetical protein